MTEPCCKWDHVRPCGPVPGAEETGEPLCACGCSGFDERCGGGEWWHSRHWTAEVDDLIGGAIVTTYPKPASEHDNRKESDGGVPWHRGYIIAEFMTMEDAEVVARLLNEAGIERKLPQS